MREGCCEGVWCGNWCGTEVVMAGTVIGEGRECVGAFLCGWRGFVSRSVVCGMRWGDGYWSQLRRRT